MAREPTKENYVENGFDYCYSTREVNRRLKDEKRENLLNTQRTMKKKKKNSKLRKGG